MNLKMEENFAQIHWSQKKRLLSYKWKKLLTTISPPKKVIKSAIGANNFSTQVDLEKESLSIQSMLISKNKKPRV